MTNSRPTALARARTEGGSALVVILMVLAVFSALGISLVILGGTEIAIARNWGGYSQAFYAADAAIQSGIVGLRTLLATTPTPTTAQLGAIGAPSLSVSGVSFTSFSISRVRTTPPYEYQVTYTSGPYAGLWGLVTDYQIRADATGPGGTRSKVTQGFQHIQIPLFQFGVLYGKGVDLEIAPGPPMTFNGKVHANSNIYVGAGATLQFDSYVTATGSIYRRLKSSSSVPWGNDPRIMDAGSTVQTLDFDHEYRPGFGSTWTASEWMDRALTVFGGRVRDSAMGVAEIVPPIPALFDNPSNPDVVSHQLIERIDAADPPDLQAAKLYSRAGLRIIDGSVTDINNLPVVLPPGVVTTKAFYDAREGQTMTVTEIDVGLLRLTGHPVNGVLYAARTGPGGNGVRLVNGAEVPNAGGGFTVVSENPVYVQGNYNTTNKVPAAVLGDAITVLSNNWTANGSDLLGDQVTSARPASPTTINAAFALGHNTESIMGQGNGQLENLIRFLENWTGQDFTYSGSLVSLWHSQQATANWRCCGDSGTYYYYNPPNRIWGYDTLFNTSQPPGAPAGVIMVKTSWAKR
jgi:hypothetical protein